MTKTEEELAFWRCIFSGLLVNYLMRARKGNDMIGDYIDLAKPDAADRVCDFLFMAGIDSGAYAEAGLSLDDVRRILKELGAPDVVQQWGDDLHEACAQNRRFIEADENERSKWN